MAIKVRTIDVHAHIFDEPMMDGIRRIMPELNCRLTEKDAIQARLHLGEIQQWPHPLGAWDMAQRLRDMDDNGVDDRMAWGRRKRAGHETRAAAGSDRGGHLGGSATTLGGEPIRRCSAGFAHGRRAPSCSAPSSPAERASSWKP